MGEAAGTPSSQEQPPFPVSTTPLLRSGGSQIKATLRIVSPDVAKTKVAGASLAIPIVALMFGVVTVFMGSSGKVLLAGNPTALVIFAVAVGVPIGLMVVFKKLIPRVVFDRKIGEAINFTSPKITGFPQWRVKLDNIAGLQLIAKASAPHSSLARYELNLVLQEPSGERCCVIPYGARSALEKDARSLADFLGKPLWNQIDQTMPR